MNIKIIGCWVAFVLLNCASQSNFCKAEMYTQKDSVSQVIEIRIDPVTAVGVIDDLLFDSIKYIPLETNRQSEISTISKLVATEKYYIILDQKLNTVFFFNHNGSFSHKIHKDGKNASFKSIHTLTVDQLRHIVSFSDFHYQYTFDFEGNLLKKEDLKSAGRDFALFRGYKLSYLSDDINNDDSKYFKCMVRYDAMTGKHLGNYVSVDTVRLNFSLSGTPNYFYQSDKDRLLFTQPYEYIIYEFDNDAIPHERYKIVLPLNNTLPIDFLNNPLHSGKWNDYLKSNGSIIFSIQDVYTTGKWITFKPFHSIKGSAFIYNLETNDLFNLNETKDSALGLSITEQFFPVLGVNNGALISELPFVSLKKMYEELPKSKRDAIIPENLKHIMSKTSHNPILRVSHLK